MPLAVSATTFSGRSAAGVDERAHVVGEVVEQVERLAAARRGRRRAAGPRRPCALISREAGVLADRAWPRRGTA